MKFLHTSFILIALFSLSQSLKAEDSYSFGLGIGTSYSGLGANISHLSEHDMQYLSFGCMSYSSANGSSCGAGIGWIKTDIFNANSNKHGLGGYIGIVGSERKPFQDLKALYGFGVGYHYFPNGIANGGANYGFTVVTEPSEKEFALILQAGYQF